MFKKILVILLFGLLFGCGSKTKEPVPEPEIKYLEGLIESADSTGDIKVLKLEYRNPDSTKYGEFTIWTLKEKFTTSVPWVSYIEIFNCNQIVINNFYVFEDAVELTMVYETTNLGKSGVFQISQDYDIVDYWNTKDVWSVVVQ